MLSPDDLKALVETISPLIDARARTTETLIKGEINSAKEEMRAEILAARAEAKADNLSLAGKVVGAIQSNTRRIEELEKDAGIPNPKKN